MMRTTTFQMMLALSASISTAYFAAAGAERLASPAAPGFIVGYSAASANGSIKEEVPRGETVEAWSRMVTTQRFGGVASRTTPAAYARVIVAQLAGACPGASTSAIVERVVARHATARFRADCPQSAGGRPESFVLLAIAGRSDMHVKQAAVRGTNAPDALAWGERLLDATILCDAADRRPACR